MLRHQLPTMPKLSVHSWPAGIQDNDRQKRIGSKDLGKHLETEREFHAWMDNYEQMIRHMIVGFEAKTAVQDELFQEVALNIWKAIPTFQNRSSQKTFVARITQNVLASHVAKAVKTVKSSSIEDSHVHEPFSPSTPYSELNQLQRQQLLQKAIQTLKFEQQQVLTLALEGLSYKEIGEVLDISVANVGVRLQRAKQSIVQILEA